MQMNVANQSRTEINCRTFTRVLRFLRSKRDTLDDFKKLSGLAINPSKTEGMWIGSPEEIKQNLLELNGQMNLSKLWESATPMIQNYF